MAGEKLIQKALQAAKAAHAKRYIADPLERDINLGKFLQGTKTVNDEGDLFKLYHITKGDISEFIPGGPSAPNLQPSGPAIWLSANPEYLPATHNVGYPGEYAAGTNVMPLWASMKNPLVVEKGFSEQKYGSGFPFAISPEGREKLIADGYDSVINRITQSGQEEYLALHPNQVKSATGNAGTFDPTSPRIEENRGGTVEAALHAIRHHLAGGGFLSDLFSGPDYLSTGEVASPTNWGNPDLPSDFFRADKAALALAKRPTVGEPGDDVTGSVPAREPLTAPRPGVVKATELAPPPDQAFTPVRVEDLVPAPVSIPFAAPERGIPVMGASIAPASFSAQPLAFAPEPEKNPARAAIDEATKISARAPQGPDLNDRQRDLIIRTIAAETSGKSPEESQAIAHVILNRIQSGKYGATPEAVLFARKQFEPWSNPNGANYPMRFTPESRRYGLGQTALDAALGAEDITKGATNFWAPKAQAALGRRPPKWGRTGGVDIGETRFHNLSGEARPAGAVQMAQAQEVPSTGLFAFGTNDPNPQTALKSAQQIYENARRAGIDPVFVLPNSADPRFAPISEALKKYADERGIKYETPGYDPKDPLHITPDTAKEIAKKYPGALVGGDSNSWRLQKYGYGRPVSSPNAFVDKGTGVKLGQVGAGSPDVAKWFGQYVDRLSRGRASGGLVDDALHVVREHHADGEAVGQAPEVPAEEPRPLTIYRGNAPVADEAGGSGREAVPAFSYMPMPESVERQAARQPAYNPAERTWSDAGSTEGERFTRALGVEGELPKGETFMSPQPTGWDKYMPQRRQGTYLKRTGEAFNENADAVTEGLKAVREGNYGAGALGMVGGALGAAISPLTGMERVLVRDPYLRMTGNLKDAQAAEMAADVALTGGLRGMVKPFAKAGSLERMATEPWNRVRMPSPAAAGAATAAGAMLAPEDAEASKLSKAMEVARMAIPRELSPLGFYSHGAEAARGLPQAKGTAQQFTSMLDKAGIRGPEMESYLQTFGGRPIVTREEIAKHFQDTMPKLTERVNYDEGVTGPDWTTTGGGTRFGEHALSGGENYREVRMMLPPNETPAFAIRYKDGSQMGSAYPSEKEARAALEEMFPGRSDLEVVPERATDDGTRTGRALTKDNFTTSHWPGDPNVVAHLRMSDRTGPNGEKILHVEEIQSDWAQKARGLRDDEIMRVMKDKNLDWDEANKIVSSDFGFKKPAGPMMEAKLGAAEDAYNEAANSHQELLKQINQSIEKMPDPRTMSPGDYNRAQQAHEAMRQDVMRANPDFEASANRVRQASQDLTSLREQQSLFDKSEGVPTGPYVTKTPQWTDLALKRALKEAAEGGYDRVVFTPGAEQAKRWDLQHHVNNITWSAEPDGTYWVGATGKDGKPIPGFENKPMTPRELRETFGSDIAKKIMKGEGKPMVGGPELELSGLDLQTGEGMRSYYDKIVPKRLQELIKKHDPEARVGAHEIPNTGEKRRQGYADVGEIMNWHPSYTNLSRQEQSAQWNAMSPVNRRQLIKDYESAQSGDITGHGIDITPAMRESILRGQSAHARGGEVVDHALSIVRQ